MGGNLFVVSAPSGAGKTSLTRALIEEDPDVRLSVSHTTRAPRPGERDGQHYHFVDREEFLRRREAGEFLESAEVYGHFYGTSLAAIEDSLAQGRDVLLDIDWQGARAVRARVPDCATVFILPPSVTALEARLRGRAQDSDAVIRGRLAAAHADLSHVDEFDYVIINDTFEQALADLRAVVRARRLRWPTQAVRHSALLRRLLQAPTLPDAPRLDPSRLDLSQPDPTRPDPSRPASPG